MIMSIDLNGRLVIPTKYRKEFNLESGSDVNVIPLPDKSGVAIINLVPKCASCGGSENLTNFHNIPLCPKCRKQIEDDIIGGTD